MLQQIPQRTRGMIVQNYRSQSELQRLHPEHKSYKCIYHAPRGMSGETQITNLRRIIQKQNITAEIIYQVGDFFWIPETCVCLERIGDNGPCPKHGPGLPQGRVQ
jgi:hypothetical protein